MLNGTLHQCRSCKNLPTRNFLAFKFISKQYDYISQYNIPYLLFIITISKLTEIMLFAFFIKALELMYMHLKMTRSMLDVFLSVMLVPFTLP